MTSIGSVDNKFSESILTPSESLPLRYAVGVAVGGLLMVFVAVAVIVITLLVVKRGQAHKIREGEEILASSPDHDVAGYTSVPSIGYSGDCRILLL